jgi:hypothetical protein
MFEIGKIYRITMIVPEDGAFVQGVSAGPSPALRER